MIAVPITNDQPGSAARVAWTGAGEILPPEDLTPRRLRALALRLREDVAYKAAAERIRQSIEIGGVAPRAAILTEQALARRG